ncbi:universal stress protein [Nesterenkonia rhizosphaerae]|uniref:UspA domain-containing protein n=1 Tax=Nesterenkonia rhizosphaerae TaxID=1348272 RepID=A0ABP9FV98_9MICC
MASPIVVGVDGSPTARKAAEVARDLAVKLGSPLHVFTAYVKDSVTPMKVGTEEWVASTADDAQETAERVVRNVVGDGDAVAASGQGAPADALIAYAEEIGAQLIVVGNQRMRGVSRVLGSVANSVSHNATCDVYIANTYAD